MASFDGAALDYDDDFTFSRIGQQQREQVWTYLETLLETSGRLKILELNCGTGYDAAFLARGGHDVVATDVSEQMLIKTKKRIQSEHLSDKVSVYRYDLTRPIGEIGDTEDPTWEKESYDLIFSNFGGLNCLSQEELGNMADDLIELLKKEGSVVMVVMPRYCLMDLLYNGLRLKVNKVYKRLFSRSIQVDVDEVEVTTFYHSLSRYSKSFIGCSLIDTRVISFLPSYLERWIHRIPLLLSLDRMMVSILKKQRAFAPLCDHALIHIKK